MRADPGAVHHGHAAVWRGLFDCRQLAAIARPSALCVTCPPAVPVTCLPACRCRENPILLLEPGRVFNLDETNFMADAGKERVLAAKGSRSAKTVGNTNRDSVTLLITISVDGKALPPYVVAKGSGDGPPRLVLTP